MPDLKYAVIFSAVDQLSDKLSSFGGGFLDLSNRVSEFGGKLSEAGDNITKFGERLSLDTMLMKQGADELREMSSAISEPAFAMQRSMATAAAMTGLTNNELADLKETAIAFSQTHPGTTAEQYVEGFTRMREIFQDTKKAMDAEGAAAMLSRFGIQGEAATNLFTAAFSNLHVAAADTGDQVFKTVQAFGLAPESAQQLAMVVGRLGGTAAQTNTPLAELLALGGAASQQFGGGARGAMMFASMIREMVQASAEGKSSIDFTHGLAGGLSQLRAQIAGLPRAEKLELLKNMGATDPAGMVTFLENLDSTLAKQRAIADSAGALGDAYTIATDNASDKIAQLHQNVNALYDSMASPALPMYSSAIGWLTKEVQGATDASQKHSAVLGDVVFGMSAVGNLAGGAISALSTLGAASIFAGQGMKALGWAMGMVDFESLALRAMYLWDAISGIGAAAWAFLASNPIGWVVIAAAALAAAGYEVYEHWSAVKNFFSGFGTWLGGWASTIGKAVLIGLTGPFGLIATEIYSHWDSIKAACEKIGGGILDFFFGHSPPPVGPLHDLGRITIAETIAERIRPAPVLAAIRRTAAAAAIASSTIIGAGAGSSAMAAGGAPTVNFTLNINGSRLTKAEHLDLVREARREIEHILEGERARKERTVLS